LGKRTGRRRGAPDGNENRRTHGRYAAAAVARRRAVRARLLEAQLLSAWTDVVERIIAMERAGLPVPPGLTTGR
jgi:hypothetical protein